MPFFLYVRPNHISIQKHTHTPVEKGENTLPDIQVNLDMSYFNKPYLPMLNNEERFNVVWGGAGSGKSHFVVQKIILKALKYPNRTILFTRKVQATIKDSIFQLAIDELNKMGILHLCDVSYYTLTIKFPNGSRIFGEKSGTSLFMIHTKWNAILYISCLHCNRKSGTNSLI